MMMLLLVTLLNVVESQQPVATIPILMSSFQSTAGLTVGCTIKTTVGAEQELPYELGLDMGFDWLMVTSSACTSSALCGSPSATKYVVQDPQADPSFSSTYGFGIFKATGVQVPDSVSYQTTGSIPLDVPKGLFAGISAYSAPPGMIPDSVAAAYMGSVGLAYPSAHPSLNFITSREASGLVQSRVFAISLPSNLSLAGTLEVGGFSAPSVSWFPLGPSSWAGHPGLWYWTSQLQSLAIGGAPVKCGKCNFFIDTAGGGLVLAGAPTIQVPLNCSGIGGLPTITFSIFSLNFQFAPADYVLRIDGLCYSSITSVPSASFSVLGTTWLMKYPTIFDIDNSRIGVSI